MEKIHCPPIAVLGAGSWGTALAIYLARLGQAVHLWAHEESAAREMQQKRCNARYLPDYMFPPSLFIHSELQEAVEAVEEILIVVPSSAFHLTLLRLKPLLKPSARIIWATKGLDSKTGQLLHEVALAVLGKNHLYGVISGPSFAKEVVKGLPTAVVAASRDITFSKELVARFNSEIFRVYSSTDMIGVEIGGVIKNVLAIATGISDGMEFGANARSALITRGLAEMMRLGIALGGQTKTFMGLTGVGDLVLTCTDNQSRNRRFGLSLGQGKTATQAEHEIGQVIEGKKNAELIVQFAKKNQVEMPIAECVFNILNGALTPHEAMRQLLSRTPKDEF